MCVFVTFINCEVKREVKTTPLTNIVKIIFMTFFSVVSHLAEQ